jgi:hypothetical protein
MGCPLDGYGFVISDTVSPEYANIDAVDSIYSNLAGGLCAIGRPGDPVWKSGASGSEEES